MITTIFAKDLHEWRSRAKTLLVMNISPAAVNWPDQNSEQTDLFSTPTLLEAPSEKAVFLTPRSFITLAEIVSCHRNPNKWHLLYQALWRITHNERHLLEIPTDPLVRQLNVMKKQIQRDVHKMHAFVRFRCCLENNIEHYIAWYEPDHKITRLAAPFFKRRFAVQYWTIMTPDESVHWDGEQLHFTTSLTREHAPKEDQMEDLWRTFYHAIFNPARIKLKAMRQEMPVRFWHNLPEATIIASILHDAPQRVAGMLKHQEGLQQSAENYLPQDDLSLKNLRIAATHCQACPIYAQAHQIVFGDGKENAEIMLVGEQPGENEDLAGKPFVGPAGKLLHQALQAVNIDESKIYLTNAVKHFKHQIIAGKKIHKSPNIHEINACKPWLIAEITTIKPKLIICLGLTAAKSLISAGFHMHAQHGKWFTYNESQWIMATYHPAAILRGFDAATKDRLYANFLADLKTISAINSTLLVE